MHKTVNSPCVRALLVRILVHTARHGRKKSWKKWGAAGHAHATMQAATPPVGTMDCDALHALAVEHLSRPSMRDALGGRAHWLRNWHFPSRQDLDAAHTAAAQFREQGCEASARGARDGSASPPAAMLPNLALYLAPCLTQCHVRLPPLARQRCACRACASASSWLVFRTELCAHGSVLSPFLDPAWCEQAHRLACSSYHAHHVESNASSLTPMSDLELAGTSTRPVTNAAMPPSDAKAPHLDADGAPMALCRTAFNESCCPAVDGAAPACGGPARGWCVQTSEWMASQPLARDGKCTWPTWHAAARCLCRERFAGSACGGCAVGWQGPTCSEPRSKRPEVRPSFVSMAREGRDAFLATVRAALASSAEAAAMESAHEYGISFTHHTSSLILSHGVWPACTTHERPVLCTRCMHDPWATVPIFPLMHRECIAPLCASIILLSAVCEHHLALCCCVRASYALTLHSPQSPTHD